MEWLAWLLDAQHLPSTLTAVGVYLAAPLLVSLLIEIVKTDRLARRLPKPTRLRMRLCQMTGTTVVGAFVGYGPGVWDAGAALNHSITAGLFSVLTLGATKWALERWAPGLHEAVFFAEKRKRAAIRTGTFDPNDTTITELMNQRDRRDDAAG